nr:MBOAT family protein [Bacteroidota bacterium]
MIFNSLPFVIFLIVVFALHWTPFSRSGRHQNIILLIASYVFYGWWDVRFLSLILISSLIDYVLGMKIADTANERWRRIFLMISLSTNLGLLFFFKYFNFFVSSFKLAFGLADEPSMLDIILPVGISFYTFQTLSYTIDIYRRQLEPNRNLIEFLTFVSFFPQLVAGPIERARTLLPQISMVRVFSHDQAVVGCRFILIGAFKKIVIADSVGPIVDTIFNNQDQFGGWMNMLGLALFMMQIYG